MRELTYYDRKALHNFKYFTWVEQQGRTSDELRELWDPDFWERTFAQADEWDQQINAFNERTGVLSPTLMKNEIYHRVHREHERIVASAKSFRERKLNARYCSLSCQMIVFPFFSVTSVSSVVSFPNADFFSRRIARSA